jgi:O-antigen biosynthesis protein
MSAIDTARRIAGSALRAREGEPPDGRRIPLATLRAQPDDGSARTDWKLEADGVLGRSLQVDAGASISYPLALGGAVTFTARAMLFPHDWRDLEGAVRAAVSVSTPGGSRHLWSQALFAGDRGRAGGHRVSCVLPADTTALHLTVAPLATPPQDPVRRMIWVEPALHDPTASSLTEATAPEETVPAAIATESGPLFSVLIPVHDPPPQMLTDAVESVRAQTFGEWELCLVDDGSSNPEVAAALDEYAEDPPIRLKRHDAAQGISAATNAALEMATGRYIVLLDHDDTLDHEALAAVAERLRSDPQLDMIYTDEDVVQEDGARLERHPKPGWSPEHMAALMYTCHLGVYRRSLADELGGFQARFDGCQDFDFVLRLMERTDRIAHIPRILYHWRAHPASTATFGGGAKPHAFLSQPAAIADHLRRTGVEAEVRHGYLPGIHRIVHRVDPATSVAFVLAISSIDGLATAAASWQRQPHPTWTISIAAPASLDGEIADVLSGAGVAQDRITLTTGGLADAARAAEAEHLLLMQTAAAGLTRDWLTRLIGYAGQAGISAAGPIVLAPDGRIQQAGVALPEGIPLHLLHGLPTVAAPPAVTNVSAVSGVLLTPTMIYRALGGLKDAHRELALVEYCLRAGGAGGRIVLVPDARLRETGPDAMVNDLPEMWRLQREWAATHTHDPYYNAGYRTDRGDSSMRP